MKTTIGTSLIAVVFAFWAQPSAGVAAVYSTGVQLDYFTAPSIWAWTQPELSGFGAGISLATDSPNILRATNYSVGIGHVWFSVQPGQVIDPNTAATMAAFANAFTGDLGGRIPMTGGETFLLGFWLDANSSGTPNSGDRFGWASLRNTPSGLALQGSAIDSSGGGIIAGTTTMVPESSSAALCFLGVFLCLSRRAFRNPEGSRR